MQIIPTILVPIYSALQNQIKKIEPLFDYAQLDIMDGKFVNNKSFNYNEDRDLSIFFNDKIKSKLKYELHLMVQNPLDEIKKWKNVNNVFRVIFHAESNGDPEEIIAEIKKNNWQAGIALNPNTPLSKITPYLNSIDVVLFMTVIPGRQGNPFVKNVGEKIKKLTLLPPLNLPLIKGERTNKPIIAVDGGVNENTIEIVKSWGVDVAYVGSALMGADSIEQALNNLNAVN